MKTNGWLILGMMVATSAFAQNNTNAPTPVPAPAVAPATEAAPAPAKHKKHAEPKHSALVEPSVTLVPGTAEVMAANLNVRGQAGLKGEVIRHLDKGDKVTVLSQINLDKHQTGEPAQWAKIALPSSTSIWVNNSFINGTTKMVVPKRLNLRAGPGENFSVLGVVEHGTLVNEITTKGAWTQIEPPASAYAFVAAMYLKQEASGNLAANTAPSTETMPVPAPVPAPTPTPVVEAPPVVTEPAANMAPAANETTPAAATPMLTDTNPPPPRVVTHEGVVGPVGSIIAPTAYVLYDPSTRQNINFLYTTSTNLNISRYSGMRIVVTGEESLAERWKDTPLLTIQRIEVLETNAIPKVYYPSPRQRH